MIKLSKQSTENLMKLSSQIRELQIQFNAILTTIINEKGEEGKQYKLYYDCTELIEQEKEIKDKGGDD